MPVQVERGAEALGDEIAADERSHAGHWGKSLCRPRSTWASTEPAFRCEPKNCPGVRASSPTVLRKRGKRRSAPSGARKRATAKGCRSATKVPSLIRRRHFCEAQRMAVVADGAPWIGKITQELFPDAIQIVDRFHVKQTLHRAAQSIFGSTEQSKQWQQRVEPNWTRANCTPLFVRSVPMPNTLPTPHDADCISIAIAAACGIHNSTNRTSSPRRPRSRMQSCHRNSSQAPRHALDPGWRQQRHRATMPPSQRAVRGFLGTPKDSIAA
jgi:hypothetical protein